MSDNAENKPGATDQANAAAAQSAAVQTATAEARTAERARVSSIMSCEEAKGRTALANHIAMNTDMTLDAAKAMLSASAAAPAEAPKAAADPFKAAMDGGNHPHVGADAPAGGEPVNKAAAILGDYKAAGGMMPSQA